MDNARYVLMVLSPVIWLLLSVAFHDYFATRDDEADAVVPAMSGAFLAVLAMWGAFFLLVNSQP